MIKKLIVLVFCFSIFSNLNSMDNKLYHHLPDNTFRNPEGSPIRDMKFNWSFKVFNEEKKKLDMTIPKNHIIKMVKTQALNCFSGKQITCDIDSVCVHGDGKSAVNTAKEIKDGLVKTGVTLRSLDQLKKFA